MDTFLFTSSVCDFTHQACHCRTWGRSWPARATPSTWTSFQWSPTGRSLLQTRASFQQSSRGQNVSWLIWNSGNNCHLRLRNIFAINYYLFGQHVVLQLNIEGSSVLGVHHQEAEVQGLLGSPSDPLHIIPESLLQRGHVWVELSWRGDDFNKAAICKEHHQLSSESTEMFLPRCFWNCFWTSELIW